MGCLRAPEDVTEINGIRDKISRIETVIEMQGCEQLNLLPKRIIEFKADAKLTELNVLCAKLRR
jgi:hypothetical protein